MRHSPSWTADIALRLRRLFLLKLSGVTAVIGLFFVAYFHVLRHPAHPVTVVPLTPLDALIGFEPAMLVPYVSLWLYVGIAPGLQLTLRRLADYGLWAGALGATGLAAFYFWPTVVPPSIGSGVVPGWPGFETLRGLDAAGNACPSLHVAFAVFTAAWIEHVLRAVRVPPLLRLLNLGWVLAIVWSTLAIRQHAVLDVAVGALLGAMFALLSLHGRREDPADEAEARRATEGRTLVMPGYRARPSWSPTLSPRPPRRPARSGRRSRSSTR
jgi:hypothetical protein